MWLLSHIRSALSMKPEVAEPHWSTWRPSYDGAATKVWNLHHSTDVHMVKASTTDYFFLQVLFAPYLSPPRANFTTVECLLLCKFYVSHIFHYICIQLCCVKGETYGKHGHTTQLTNHFYIVVFSSFLQCCRTLLQHFCSFQLVGSYKAKKYHFRVFSYSFNLA